MLIIKPLISLLTVFFLIQVFRIPIQAQASCDVVVGQSETIKTLNDAINSLGANVSGRTICIKNDKDYGSTQINKGGLEGNKLIIKSHPSNTSSPKFSTTQDESAILINASNILIENLQISGSNGAGLTVSNSSNVSLINTEISNTRKAGIEVLNSSNILIDRCELSHMTPGSEGRYNNLYISNNTNQVIVQNCLIYEDQGKGGYSLGFDNASNVVFRNNELYSNSQPNIFLGNGENILIENNLVSATCVDPQSGEDAIGTGIYRFLSDSSEQVNPKFKGSKVQINNNLLVNLSKGIKLDGCKNLHNYPGEVCPFSDFKITNNTVVGIGMSESKDEKAEYALWAYLNEGTEVDALIENNIFHTKNGSESDYMPTQFSNGVNFNNNLWSDLTKLPQNGNELVTNWGEVFSENPDLSNCTNDRINPMKYKTSANRSGVGADVSKIGIGKVSGGEFPTNTPSPIVTITDQPVRCVSKTASFLDGTPLIDSTVRYSINLNYPAGFQGEVRLSDEISPFLEILNIPDYCEVVNGDVLGTNSDDINKEFVVGIIALTTVVLIIIIHKVLSGSKKNTFILSTLIIASSVILIRYIEFAPSDTPASSVNTMICQLTSSVNEIIYEATIIGDVGNTVENEAKIHQEEEMVDSCNTNFIIQNDSAPTLTPTSTVIPTVIPVTSQPVDNICGKADINNDGKFTIADFSAFAIAYKGGNQDCSDKDVEYGQCGGKDVNRDGKLSIVDFGAVGIGFAQRYYPKTSCAL